MDLKELFSPRIFTVVIFLLIFHLAGGQDLLVVDRISVEGNKITRDGIIHRECLFIEGERVHPDSLGLLARKSEENLMNTGLFNFADVNFKTNDEEKTVTFHIEVVERWYVWPVPIIKISDRNFNVWWEDKDFSRLSYGFYIDWKNLTGRMDLLRMRLQLGYDEAISFEYRLPYLNKRKTLGAGISFDYQRNHEVAISTENSKHIFYRRNDAYAAQDINVTGNMYLRKGIYNTHQFSARYSLKIFDDSLIQIAPWYSTNGTRDQYLSLYYKYKSDYRDYKPYPLQGHYFDIEVSKIGLGISNKGPDFLAVGAAFRKYWKLHEKIHYAFGLNGRFSSTGYQPYYLVYGIGYDRDIVRGYEYYVVDAQKFAILKTDLKFTLLKKDDARIPFIKTDKFGRIFYGFYLNLFVDAGYADKSFYYGETGRTFQNDLLIGYGAGIDFITYYDIVIRAEYSFNKTGESGLFIHFRASI